MSKILKSILDEAQFTREILGSGITQLGKANYARRGTYFHAFTGISTGLERIGKLCIILDYYIQNDGIFPDDEFIKNGIGHDLNKIYQESRYVIERNSIKFTFQNKIDDSLQLEMLNLLSKFAKGDRYSNIDFLLKSRYQSNPIQDWYEKIDKTLYQIKVSKKRKEKILSNAKVIGELLNPLASVRYFNESGEEINDIESASFLNGMNKSIAKYRQLYILQIVRYWVEMITGLQYNAMELGNGDIPFMTEIFAIFNNKDSYFLGRKTYDKS